MDWLTKSLDWLDQLPPAVLLLLGLLAVGYILKSTNVLPSKFIPLAVVLLGGALFPFLERARTQEVLTGMVVGLVAWLFHNQVLKRIESKVPGLRRLAGGDEDGQEQETVKPKDDT